MEDIAKKIAFTLYHQPLHGMPYDDCLECAQYIAEMLIRDGLIAKKNEE